MVASWLAVCVTHHQGLITFFGITVVILDFCFKKFGFCLHADSVVLVDFLHVLRSIEVRFISAPNPFKQMLSFFCHDYSFVNPSRDVIRLGMFGMKCCVFVNKGGQSGVILFVESISILGRVVD